MGPVIDLSVLLPWRIMQIFATAFAYYNISRSILKDKYSPVSTFGAIFAARIVTSLLFYNSDNSRSVIGYIVYCTIVFLITLFLMKGELYKKSDCHTFLACFKLWLHVWPGGFVFNYLQHHIRGNIHIRISGTYVYIYDFVHCVYCRQLFICRHIKAGRFSKSK